MGAGDRLSPRLVRTDADPSVAKRAPMTNSNPHSDYEYIWIAKLLHDQKYLDDYNTAQIRRVLEAFTYQAQFPSFIEALATLYRGDAHDTHLYRILAPLFQQIQAQIQPHKEISHLRIINRSTANIAKAILDLIADDPTTRSLDGQDTIAPEEILAQYITYSDTPAAIQETAAALVELAQPTAQDDTDTPELASNDFEQQNQATRCKALGEELEHLVHLLRNHQHFEPQPNLFDLDYEAFRGGFKFLNRSVTTLETLKQQLEAPSGQQQTDQLIDSILNEVRIIEYVIQYRKKHNQEDSPERRKPRVLTAKQQEIKQGILDSIAQKNKQYRESYDLEKAYCSHTPYPTRHHSRASSFDGSSIGWQEAHEAVIDGDASYTSRNSMQGLNLDAHEESFDDDASLSDTEPAVLNSLASTTEYQRRLATMRRALKLPQQDFLAHSPQTVDATARDKEAISEADLTAFQNVIETQAARLEELEAEKANLIAQLQAGDTAANKVVLAQEARHEEAEQLHQRTQEQLIERMEHIAGERDLLLQQLQQHQAALNIKSQRLDALDKITKEQAAEISTLQQLAKQQQKADDSVTVNALKQIIQTKMDEKLEAEQALIQTSFDLKRLESEYEHLGLSYDQLLKKHEQQAEQLSPKNAELLDGLKDNLLKAQEKMQRLSKTKKAQAVEIAELEKQLADAEADENELQIQIQALQKNNEKLIAARLEVEEAFQEHFAELHTQRQDLEHELEALYADSSASKAYITTLEEALGKVTHAKEKLQQRTLAMTAKMEQGLENAERALVEAQQKIQLLENELQLTAEAEEDQDAAIHVLQEKNAALLTAREELEKTFEEQFELLAAHEQQPQANIAMLLQKSSVDDAFIGTVQEKLNEVTQAKQLLQLQYEELAAKYEKTVIDAGAALAATQAQQDDFDTDLEETITALDELEAETRADVDSLGQQAALEAEQQVAELEAAAQEAQAKIASLTVELKASEAGSAARLSEMQALQTSHRDELAAVRQELEEAVARATASSTALQQQEANHAKTLQQLTAKQQEAHTALQLAEQEATTAKAALLAQQTQHQELEETAKKQITELQSYERQLQQAEATHTAIHEQQNLFDTQLEKAFTEFEELEKETKAEIGLLEQQQQAAHQVALEAEQQAKVLEAQRLEKATTRLKADEVDTKAYLTWLEEHELPETITAEQGTQVDATDVDTAEPSEHEQQLQQQIAELTAKHTALQKQLADQAELEGLAQEAITTTENQEQQIAKLTQQLATLHQQLKTIANEKQQAIATAEDAINLADEQAAGAENFEDTLEALLDEAKKDKSEIATTLQQNEADRRAELESELANLQQQLKHQEALIEKATQAQFAEQFVASAIDAAAERAAHERQLSTAMQQITELKQKLDKTEFAEVRAHAETDALAKQLAQVQQQLAQLKDQQPRIIAKDKAEVIAVRKQLRSQRKHMATAIEALTTQVINLTDKISVFEESYNTDEAAAKITGSLRSMKTPRRGTPQGTRPVTSPTASQPTRSPSRDLREITGDLRVTQAALASLAEANQNQQQHSFGSTAQRIDFSGIASGTSSDEESTATVDLTTADPAQTLKPAGTPLRTPRSSASSTSRFVANAGRKTKPRSLDEHSPLGLIDLATMLTT